MIYLKLFFGLFIAWLLGDVIVRSIDAEGKLQPLERLALGYLLGQGALTLLLFLLFLLPIANRMVIVSLIVLGLFALKMWLDRGGDNLKNVAQVFSAEGGSASGRRPAQHGSRPKGLRYLIIIVLLAGIIFKLSYSFVEACSKPEYSWDGAGNWTDHGKNYFYAEKYWPKQMQKELKNTVNSYPRAISLMHYWLFSWLGEVNDQWSKIVFPLELLCLLIIFYYGLRPAAGQLIALGFTYLLCSTPLFLYHSTIGYADLTKTVYFSVGVIYFYRWVKTKEDVYFWFFALSIALTTWIKLEGKALYGIGLALLLFYLWRRCQGSLKTKLGYVGKYLALFVVFGLPWQLFTKFNRLPDPQGMIKLSLTKFFEFHEKMYTLMFMEGSWGVFWAIFIAALLFAIRKQLTGENLYLFLTILLFYGNLIFVYLFFNNAVNEMVATFNRVLLPIYPIAVFDLACLLPRLPFDQEGQP